MVKPLLIIAVPLLITACGQKDQTPASKEMDDRILHKTNKGNADTPLSKEGISEYKIRHQASKADIKNLPPALARFVPSGYTAIDTTSGDLNLDTYPDMIMVLKSNGENTTSDYVNGHPEKRPLLLLIGQANDTYKLAATNNNVVYCIDCGGGFGDPFQGIQIKKGYFSIEHGIAGGKHWERFTTFKYNKAKAAWFLHREGFISYKLNDEMNTDAAELVKDVEEIKTVKDFGSVPFEKYNMYKNKW